MSATAPPVAEPVTASTFATALKALGPFESQPHLAIAVSGGADSLALAVLTAGWLRARGGRGTAITVDHGMRRAAALEAAWVGVLMRRLGLAHERLRWHASSAVSVSQAGARDGRYALMDAACARLGCLHLLVGHHAQDQAGTVAMRVRRGSGPGLAGMPAIRELRHCRILRPLLAVPRARLEATARTLGYGWVDDPSNRDPRFERTSLPAAIRDADDAGRRSAAEIADARWLASHARVEAGSAISFASHAWRALDTGAAARVVAATSAAVGGSPRQPSTRRALACARRLADGTGRVTLAGALIGWQRDRLLFSPERCDEASRRVLAGAPFAAPYVASDARLLMC